MKIRPVRAQSFHADGQTDTTKLTVPFRNFAKAPKTLYHAVQFPARCRYSMQISISSTYIAYA